MISGTIVTVEIQIRTASRFVIADGRPSAEFDVLMSMSEFHHAEDGICRHEFKRTRLFRGLCSVDDLNVTWDVTFGIF